VDETQFQEAREAYKLWLTQQLANDIRDRKEGLPPLPRSRDEQVAIYTNAPKQMRKKVARFYKLQFMERER
jgi:hypothetical protein